MTRQKINEMPIGKRYEYARTHEKKCKVCKEKKKLTSFMERKTYIINTNCNKCEKKLYEKEVIDIVLGILRQDS